MAAGKCILQKMSTELAPTAYLAGVVSSCFLLCHLYPDAVNNGAQAAPAVTIWRRVMHLRTSGCHGKERSLENDSFGLPQSHEFFRTVLSSSLTAPHSELLVFISAYILLV